MKKLGLIMYGLFLMTIFVACGNEMTQNGGSEEPAQYMTFRDAKVIALQQANVSAKDAIFIKEDLDNERGRKVYDIEFMVDQYKYEYEIDAVNGEIILEEREVDEIFD